MCMEDVRLGRDAYDNRYRYTIPAGGSLQVLSANPDRYSLLIPSHGNVTTLAADTVDLPGITQGSINLAYQNLRISISTDGGLCTSAWYVSNSGLTSQDITVWETILRKK